MEAKILCVVTAKTFLIQKNVHGFKACSQKIRKGVQLNMQHVQPKAGKFRTCRNKETTAEKQEAGKHFSPDRLGPNRLPW
jgi:hypothetical protein